MPGLQSARAMKADPVQVDPKHYEIVAENERVRVLRVSFGPHEISPMHSHPRAVIVHLTDHHSKNTDSAGESTEMRARSGDVQWIEATDHLSENLSPRPMKLIMIELKS